MLPREPFDRGENTANPFGWRLSLIGLALIVLLGGLAVYRHYTLDVPIGFQDPAEVPEARHYYLDRADKAAAARDSSRQDTSRKQ